MAINERQTKNAIHEGICKANKKYEKWSKGLWVIDSGVEGLMVAEIAEKINNRQSKRESLQMELAFEYIRKQSTSRPAKGPRSKALNDGNRADIVLFNKNEKPVCVIEVKRSWNYDSCWRDLHRICALVDRHSSRMGGSLECGYLALMLAKGETKSKSAKTRVKEYFNEIKEFVGYEFSRNTQCISFGIREAGRLPECYQKHHGEWQAASFIIQISNRN